MNFIIKNKVVSPEHHYKKCEYYEYCNRYSEKSPLCNNTTTGHQSLCPVPFDFKAKKELSDYYKSPGTLKSIRDIFFGTPFR